MHSMACSSQRPCPARWPRRHRCRSTRPPLPSSGFNWPWKPRLRVTTPPCSHCCARRPGMASHKPRKHRSEEHTSELQSPCNLVCRLLLEKKKKKETVLPRHNILTKYCTRLDQ